MAMIGNPKLIFIDEATTGVDPASRNIIWQGIRNEGRNSAVIYTTHSMEEAEAITNKLTVMVRGFFKCFGSLQDIKFQYGEGFEIFFNLNCQKIMERTLDPENANKSLKTTEMILQTLGQWQQIFKRRSDRCVINLTKEFSKEGLFRRLYVDFKRT